MKISTEMLRRTVGTVAVLAIVLSSITVAVREEHSALITRFGKPVRVLDEAGLHWKLPWPLERASTVDRRLRVMQTRHTEMLTRDKRNVILLSFVVWHVEDPLLFFRSVGSLEAAQTKLDGLVTNAKIGALGRHDLAALVSTDPTTLRVPEIERDVLRTANEVAVERYGVTVDQVGFQRLSLPEANTSFVFDQMRAERRKEAARYRAEGRREGTKIRAQTDLEKAEILAEGREAAAKVRGEAEAEAARIYAEAHRLDPELYRFVRQLESLEKVIDEQTTVIMRTDSPPFSILEKGGE